MFPKAQIKRFNDNVGCAPPPGSYDPKSGDKAQGGVVDKSERFREPKAPECSSNTSVNVSTVGSAKTTPVKQLFAAPQPVKSGRKLKTTPTNETARIKELEQQLKSLLKEKNEKERQVGQKEDELKKLDGKLHNVQSDRSSLQAKLATANREMLDIKKTNNLLKSKETSSEATSKKLDDLHSEITSLKQQLSHKDGEVGRLRKELDTILAALLASLHTLEALTVAIEEHVHGKTQTETSKVDKSKKVKTADEFIAKVKEEKLTDAKIKLVKKRTQELNQRFQEALGAVRSAVKTTDARYKHVTEEYEQLKAGMDSVKQQLQQAIDTRLALEQHRDSLLESNTSLKDQIQHQSTEHSTTLENHKATTQTVSELQESKAALEARFEDLQQVHEAAQRELQEKTQAFQDKEMVVSATTSQMHERLVELQAENEDFVATLRETGELLSQTKEENVKLEEALQQMQENWSAEKKELLVKLENVSVEKSKFEGELADASKKVEVLNGDLEQHKAAAEGKINELNAQLEGEKSELMQLQNKLGDLVYEKSQLHTEIGHLEAQLKLVKCESEQVTIEADKAFEAVPALKQRIEVLNHAKAEAEEKAEDLQEQNETLQKTLEIFQLDFDSYTKTMEGDKVEAERRILGLEEEVAGLKEQKDQMARELDDWLTDKSELDIEIAKLHCRIKVLEMDNNQLQEETQAELKEEKAELQNVRADFDKEKACHASVRADCEKLVVELESVRTEFDNEKACHASVRADCEKLGAELDSVKAEFDEEKACHTSMMVDREKLGAELESVKAEKRQMETDMEQHGIDLLSNAAQIQSLEQQLHCKTQLCEESEQNKQTLTEELDKVKFSHNKTQQSLEVLREAYNNKTQQCELAEQSCQSLTEELGKVRVSHSEVQHSLDELRVSYNSKCSECESLAEDNVQLGEELKTRQEDCEDMECRLEQLRADFIKRCGERDELRETNQVKDKSLAVLAEQVSTLNAQMNEHGQALLDEQMRCMVAEQRFEETEKDRVLYKQQSSNFRQQIEDYKEHLHMKCDECDDLKQKYDDMDIELTLSARELVDLQEKFESLQRYNVFLYGKLVHVTNTGYQLKEMRPGPASEKKKQEEKVLLVDTLEAELAEMRLQQAETAASPEMEAELAKYKAMYEDLQAKVEPFMEQIDAFELEKQTLLGMTKNTQAEMERLANDYAKLLGHQNQKQKIKHIVKIKEENNNLKQENMTLKSQVAKHKRTLQKLEEKDTPRRFDPSKAFKSTRESLNTTVPKSPLKEVNRK